jgi:hypothetical protein
MEVLWNYIITYSLLNFTQNAILVQNYYPGSGHYAVTAFTLIELNQFKTGRSLNTSVIEMTGYRLGSPF